MAVTTLPMTVLDNGNGTISATVTGTTAGRTLNLLRTLWSGKMKTYNWTSVATQAISSTTTTIADLATDFGYYQWLAVETLGSDQHSITGLVYRNVVDPEYRAVWSRCVEATKISIDGLNLSGIPESRVVPMWYPTLLKDISPTTPACIVAPFGPEQFPNNLNDSDNVSYGVLVVLVDGINRQSKANFDRDLLWREQVSRALRFQRLAGVSEIWNTVPEPDTVVPAEAWKANFLIQATLYRFISREPRGLTS